MRCWRVRAGWARRGRLRRGRRRRLGRQNPFYAASTLPYHAPPFDKIKDTDYQPALEAGMAAQIKEVEAIANNPAAPTFENTLVALEKSGQLYTRVAEVFDGVTQANTNPTLEKVNEIESPKRAAHDDAIFLNEKLFARVAAIHKQIEFAGAGCGVAAAGGCVLQEVCASGANLSAEDKDEAEEAERGGIDAGEQLPHQAAGGDQGGGLLDDGQERAEGADGRATGGRGGGGEGAQGGGLRAAAAEHDAAAGAGFAGGPRDAAGGLRGLVEPRRTGRGKRYAGDDCAAGAVARGEGEAAGLRELRGVEPGRPDGEDARGGGEVHGRSGARVDGECGGGGQGHSGGDRFSAAGAAQKGGFQLQPWDWDFYSEQVRKAKYDIDEAQVRPYFELNNVLQNGVFYAANQMYGLTFKERKDIPVYAPDVRVFEVFEASGKPLALFYCDYFKRDNKGGGAWMSTFVDQSKLLGTLPVIYNVANFSKPAAGEPALISFTDVTTMFHEFGHGLHGMFSNVEYPLLSGTNVPRDFVEFPSQFNEHWASYPAIFDHFAKHYKTGAPMPAEMAAKLRKAEKFNQGYMLTELLAAAELDMQWHTISAADGRCRIRTRSSRRRWSGRRWRWRRCLRATGRATSRTYGAKAMRRDTTRICGARCWTTMRTSGSWSTAGRRAPTESASAGWCCRRDIPRSWGRCTRRGWAAEPTAGPMLKQRGLVEDGAGK